MKSTKLYILRTIQNPLFILVFIPLEQQHACPQSSHSPKQQAPFLKYSPSSQMSFVAEIKLHQFVD